MCIFGLISGLNEMLSVFSKVENAYCIKHDTYGEEYRINNKQEFGIIKHYGQIDDIDHDRHVKNQQDVNIP
jgi:hypothetical protein